MLWDVWDVPLGNSGQFGLIRLDAVRASRIWDVWDSFRELSGG